MQSNLVNRHLRQSDHSSDFVIRERQLKLWQAVGIFVLAFVLIVAVSELRQYIGGTPVFVIVLVLVIAAIAWFTIFFVQMNRDMLLASEFQNALFANAAVVNSRFCFIIKHDGMIVYFDPGFQKTFPLFTKQEHRTIDTLLATAGIAQADGERILNHIDRGASGKVIFPLKVGDRDFNMILTIDPLARPSGFFLVRGREYIEPRAESLEASHPLASYAPELLEHILQSLPVGILAVDASGCLRHISHALAELLEYTESELLSVETGISTLIHQMGQRKPGQIELEAFEGEALLRKKSGEMVKVMIVVQPITDSSGKSVGCSIFVDASLSGAETGERKKKLNQSL